MLDQVRSTTTAVRDCYHSDIAFKGHTFSQYSALKAPGDLLVFQPDYEGGPDVLHYMVPGVSKNAVKVRLPSGLMRHLLILTVHSSCLMCSEQDCRYEIVVTH
jgi:hypothetical protein